MDVVVLSAPMALPLRHEVLRKGYPVSHSMYPEDDQPQTVHLGIRNETGDTVCTVTIFPKAHAAFKETYQYQLRGMACDSAYRNKGAGRRLAEEAIRVATLRGADLLWCNARQVAFTFYERLGFGFYGDFFESVENIPHKVMYLKLKERAIRS